MRSNTSTLQSYFVGSIIFFSQKSTFQLFCFFNFLELLTWRNIYYTKLHIKKWEHAGKCIWVGTNRNLNKTTERMRIRKCETRLNRTQWLWRRLKNASHQCIKTTQFKVWYCNGTKHNLLQTSHLLMTIFAVSIIRNMENLLVF